MPLIKGLELPSSYLYIRLGYDGNEPAQIVRKAELLTVNQRRLALAINTSYPEVEGGFYINWSLIGLIQEGLEMVGLWVVEPDVYREGGLVPVEERASLEIFENYLLVTRSLEVKGTLQLWTFHTGGGGAFYDDKLVIDILSSECILNSFLLKLRELLPKFNVAFKEFSPSAPRPRPRTRNLKKWLFWLR